MSRLRFGAAVGFCALLSACMGVSPSSSLVASNNARVTAVQQREAQQARDLQGQMAAAQQGAIRPGDDALTCDQLQSEVIAAAKDPAVQAAAVQNGVIAQQEIADRNRQMAAAEPAMAAAMAVGLLSSLMPVGGNLVAMGTDNAMTVMQSQMAAQSAEESAPQMAQLMQNMAIMMPQMMRGQRVMQLAKTKNCEFMRGVDVPSLPPGISSPSAAGGLIGAGVVGNGNAAGH